MAHRPPVMPAAASAGTRKSERYELVEAGRGLASVMVLLFHSLVNYNATPLAAPLAAVDLVARHGWLGVHAFFAISGWCIAQRFAVARAREESAGHFLRDRFLRIYPTYWAALLATLALRLAALPFNSTQFGDAFPPTPAAWAGTLLLLDPYLGTPGYLTVSWSLVFELGFYLCAALALIVGPRRLDEKLVFLAGAALCAVPWVFPTGSPWIVLDLWPNFFVGVAAWCVVRRGARTAGSVVLIALALAALTLRPAERTGLLVATGTAALLVCLHPWDRALSGTRVGRGLLWCGTISYSLYLIHVPFLSAALNLATRFLSPASPAFAFAWLGAVAIAFAAGWALAHGVEIPLQRWRKRRALAAA